LSYKTKLADKLFARSDIAHREKRAFYRSSLQFSVGYRWSWLFMAGSKEQSGISLADRLAHGNLTVAETRRLKNRSHSGFYEDVKRGLVAIEKSGRKSIVRGPVAQAYIEGRPISEVA
jgi:hypothetical protein